MQKIIDKDFRNKRQFNAGAIIQNNDYFRKNKRAAIFYVVNIVVFNRRSVLPFLNINKADGSSIKLKDFLSNIFSKINGFICILPCPHCGNLF